MLEKKHNDAIYMFFEGPVEYLPPMISSAVALQQNGGKVKIFGASIANKTSETLNNNNVNYEVFFRKRPRSKLIRGMGKILFPLHFWLRVRFDKPSIVWLHQSHTVCWYGLLPFGCKLLIHHSHELTCHSFWRWLAQKLLARRADIVIVPEENRLQILKHFSRGKGSFCMIPNQPLDKFEQH